MTEADIVAIYFFFSVFVDFFYFFVSCVVVYIIISIPSLHLSILPSVSLFPALCFVALVRQ